VTVVITSSVTFNREVVQMVEDSSVVRYDTVFGWIIPPVLEDRCAIFFKGVILFLTLGDGGSKILQNTGSALPDGAVSHPGMCESSAAGMKTPDLAGRIFVGRFQHLFWSQWAFCLIAGILQRSTLLLTVYVSEGFCGIATSLQQSGSHFQGLWYTCSVRILH